MVGTQAVNRRRWWDEDEVVASLDFGLATATADFDGAFRLLHDSYVRDGHMTPHPTGRRVRIFNALPSTRVFVAKDRDRVVGTVTLVLDSPIGLPMDQVYRPELSGLRARGRRLGEAGTLTVDRDYRASGVAILARLFRMLSLYAARIARLHELVMVVAPHHARFYETCFPIRQFGPLRPYPRINGTRVIGLVGDLVMTRALIRVARFGVSLGGVPGLLLRAAALPASARPPPPRPGGLRHDSGPGGPLLRGTRRRRRHLPGAGDRAHGRRPPAPSADSVTPPEGLSPAGSACAGPARRAGRRRAGSAPAR